MSKLVYKLVEAQKAISRFGNIITNKGVFEMPAPSPGIRTKYDIKALVENIENGMFPHVITPYGSCKNSIMPQLKGLLGLSYEDNSEKEKIKPNILIVPDPEYEALSFNCIARYNYVKLGGMDANFRSLFSTKLTGQNVGQVWKQITKDYGYTGIKDWASCILDGVESDVFFAPTPMMFATPNSVSKAFEQGYNIIDESIDEAKYTLNGIHFLLHWKLFKENDEESAKARQKIYSELDTWNNSNRDRYSGLIFSFKLYDNNYTLLDHNSGSARRQIFSEFIQEVSERVRRADGGVVGHNVGNWTLGVLDSGADIATFRMSGDTKIDVPIVLNKKARDTIKQRKQSMPPSEKQPKIPSLFSYDTLNELDVEGIKKLWEKEGTIKKAEPYWEWEKYSDRRVYCIRTRCGSLVELGEEYRNSALDVSGIPISEAIRRRIISSNISQELQDLCPSLKTLYDKV